MTKITLLLLLSVPFFRQLQSVPKPLIIPTKESGGVKTFFMPGGREVHLLLPPKGIISTMPAAQNQDIKYLNSSLFDAVVSQDVDKVSILLNQKASSNAKNDDGDTPLILACKLNNLDLVKKLLNFFPNIDYINSKTEESALRIACSNNNKDIFDSLLKNKTQVVRINDSTQKDSLDYLLKLACEKNSVDVVKILLLHKANPEISFPKYPEITQQIVLNNKLLYCLNKEEVKTLLDAGADVNARDIHQSTPLINACYSNEDLKEIVQMLLAAKADVNLSNISGQTPLINACEKQKIEIVQMLLDAKANPNVSGGAGAWTPLKNGCKYQNSEIVKMLLDAGANVDFICDQKITALMYCCKMHPNPKIVKMLLDAGADVNFIPKYSKKDFYQPLKGCTPLKVFLQMVERLRKHNEKINIDDKALMSCLTTLISSGISSNKGYMKKPVIDSVLSSIIKSQDRLFDERTRDLSSLIKDQNLSKNCNKIFRGLEIRELAI